MTVETPRAKSAQKRVGDLTRNVVAQMERRRRALGWSVEDLVKQFENQGVAIGRMSVARLQQGKRTLSVDELLGLAAVFGIQDPWLLTLDLPECADCHSSPPRGFRCLSCGTDGVTAV